MLLEISIKDFAIIDSLHLRLNRLFNVFTGETGAGKSIIIDAVNALLGGKIGAEFVRAGCERASVEGVFSLEALPPVSDEWLPLEVFAHAGGNGASTMFEVLEQTEQQQTQQTQPLSSPDPHSADARVAL
ncbi:MAG TPA: AAA family ATPase, partial [Ktedonobacteraceae bacterium]|nr:AAA family ATPase [Ktedonobacteraceae bacterium]